MRRVVLIPWLILWASVGFVGRVLFCLGVYMMWFNKAELRQSWRDTQ